MKTACVVIFAALIAGAGSSAGTESAIFDRNGRMTSMFYSGEELGVRGRVQIASRDRSRVAEPAAPARGGVGRDRKASSPPKRAPRVCGRRSARRADAPGSTWK